MTLAAFALIRLVPGDPFGIMVGERRLDPDGRRAPATPGPDEPLPQQSPHYVGQLLRGDLGTSLVTRGPVAAEFAALFPVLLETAALNFPGLGVQSPTPEWGSMSRQLLRPLRAGDSCRQGPDRVLLCAVSKTVAQPLNALEQRS